MFRVMHLDHAETLPCRCLHHPPTFDETDACGTQGFESVRFRVDVIALDIQMHTRFVRDLLHLNVQVAGCVAKLRVYTGLFTRVRIDDGHAEGSMPEVCGGVEIIGFAVNDESGKSATMGHDSARTWLQVPYYGSP